MSDRPESYNSEPDKSDPERFDARYESSSTNSGDKPVYAISVAADLVNMHPQTLRQYERRGLVQPQRDGKNRLYSQNDIDRIMYIQKLTQDLGVNLAGVEEISRLQLELERQKQKNADRDSATAPADLCFRRSI